MDDLSNDRGPAALVTRTGMARHTVRRGLAELTSAGWHPVVQAGARSPGEPIISLPDDLVLAKTVGVQAKLLYGYLQLSAGFRNPIGQ